MNRKNEENDTASDTGGSKPPFGFSTVPDPLLLFLLLLLLPSSAAVAYTWWLRRWAMPSSPGANTSFTSLPKVNSGAFMRLEGVLGVARYAQFAACSIVDRCVQSYPRVPRSLMLYKVRFSRRACLNHRSPTAYSAAVQLPSTHRACPASFSAWLPTRRRPKNPGTAAAGFDCEVLFETGLEVRYISAEGLYIR